MATQVVILRAVRSLAPHLARLKNATKAFFNGMQDPGFPPRFPVILGIRRHLRLRGRVLEPPRRAKRWEVGFWLFWLFCNYFSEVG